MASLDDALVKLELEPAHDALRLLLEPSLVRLFADLAEHPRTLAGGVNPALEAERTEFFETAWARCENFLRQAQKSYLALAGCSAAAPANPSLLRAAFRERLRSAMRIPALEALFPAPWTVAARRMLPSPSPQLTATAMWGPVLGWCVLELLAESIDAENSGRMALELFDRLRLREPFAQLFAALGFEGEEAWRVAARVKVGLLIGAGVGKAQAAPAIQAAEKLSTEEDGGFNPRVKPIETTGALAPEKLISPISPEIPSLPAASIAPEGEASAPSPVLWPSIWLDADVRWLCGVHEAEGHDYLVRERYEELLWWLLMPSLLRLAGESAPGRVASNRAAVRAMSSSLEEALATAEAAGYRVDLLLAPAAVEVAGEEPAAEAETTPDAAVETAAESETAAEVQPLSIEVPEPAGPEIESAAIEPVAESEAASIPEPVPDAEATPVPEEQIESTEEPEPDEPEIEAALEPAVELIPEAEAASIPEPEPIAEATPVPAEQLDSTEEPEPAEPEIEAAIEPAVELVPESESEAASIPEPEPIAEATPVPEEQLNSTEEPEPDEPEIEATLEPTVETEAATEPQPLPPEEPEPIEPEIEAAADAPASAEPIPETEEELELAADEPESAVEPAEDQTEQPEQAEAESEFLENLPSGAKTLVDSIASIFARRPVHFAKTSILGLSDTQPSSDEPWEPATPEAGFAASAAAEAEPESVQSVVPKSAFTEPWEPPPLKIEFTAKFATEYAAEPETEAEEPPLPTAHPEPAEPEPSEPENELPSEAETDPDDPLWPPRG